MFIVPSYSEVKRFTRVLQHFCSGLRSSAFADSRKPLWDNYFSSEKNLMVRTIWLT